MNTPKFWVVMSDGRGLDLMARGCLQEHTEEQVSRQELVEKMNGAYEAQLLKVEKDSCSEGMDAALSVAIDELLKPPVDWDEFFGIRECEGWTGPRLLGHERLRDFINWRRAKLERVKTPEERVAIVDYPIDHFIKKLVQLDGKTRAEFLMQSDAEIYRLGLIQQLKGSA